MSISNAQATFGMSAAGTSDRPLIVGTVNLGQQSQAVPLGGDIAFTGLALLEAGMQATVELDDFDLSEPVEVSTVQLGENVLIINTEATPNEVEVEIDDDIDRTMLSVGIGAGLMQVTSGDKRVMRVTADFGDGVETVNLFYVGTIGTGKAWSSTGSNDVPASGIYYRINAQDTEDDSALVRFVDGVLSGFYDSNDGTSFPDLINNWVAQSTATGTPVITALPATSANVAAAINAEEITGVSASVIGDPDAPIQAKTTTAFESEGERGWQRSTLDFQGEEYATAATVLGFYARAVSGAATIEIDGNEYSLTENARTQTASPDGILDPSDTVEITATQPGTAIEVVVIAHT